MAPKKSVGLSGPTPQATASRSPHDAVASFATAGLRKRKDGWVTVIARFDGVELTDLEEVGPPEALKEYATTRLIRRLKRL